MSAEGRSGLTRPLANRPLLERLLADAGIDMLVATSAPNVTYLSDYWSLGQWARRSSHAYAVFVPSHPVELVVPLGNADLLGGSGIAEPGPARTYGEFVVQLGETEHASTEERRFAAAVAGELPHHSDSLEALTAAIFEGAPAQARIALEDGGLPAGGRERLARTLAGCELIEAEPIIRRARAVKTEREVELLRTAAKLTEKAAGSALATAEPGVTEQALELAYRSELVGNGAMPLASAWTSGTRTALPNGQATERALCVNDQVRFDGGCRFGHYCADLARTAAVGKPAELFEHRYRAVVAGLEAAIDAARPGATGGDVFRVAVDAVREAGIPDYERSHCGHGIGIENYDEPLIAAGVETELVPGMVLCLETPFYDLGWGGVQVEDAVLLTEQGVERFTGAAPPP